MADEHRELLKNSDADLINQIKKYNILYDANVSDYRNPQKRQLAFQAIASNLGSSAGICENRWRVLRTRFAREYKVRTSGIIAQGTQKQKKWGLYNMMSFIAPHVIPRNKKANVLVPNDHTATSSTLPGSPSSSTIQNPIPMEIWVDSNTTSQQDYGDDSRQAEEIVKAIEETQNRLRTATFPRNATATTKNKEAEKSQDGLTKEILDLIRITDSVIAGSLLRQPQDCEEMWLLSLKEDLKRLSKENQLLFKVKVSTLLFELSKENQ